MEVHCHILEIGLQLLHHGAVTGAVAVLPERGAEVVALDELVLAVEHQLAEAALAIGLDGLHRKIRRLVGVRVARDVGSIGGCRVLEPLLVDVQIAEARIQKIGIRRIALLGHELIQRGRAVRVGERDTHDTQRVFDELTVRTLETLELRPLGAARRAEFAVQHLAE